MANTIAVVVGTVPNFKLVSDDFTNAVPGSVTITSDDGSTSVVISGSREAIAAYLQQIMQALN